MDDSGVRRLLDAVVGIASDLSLPDVLRRIVQSSCDLVDAQYGALGVVGPDRTLSEFIQVGIDKPDHDRIGRLPTGRGILGLLIDEPRPIRLADLRNHAKAFGFPAGHPQMRSFLGVPIRVRGTVFGNLYLTEKRDGEDFTEQDEETVVALAAAAGVAIENASLFEQTRRREQWLQATNHVTDALLSGEDPRAALQLIAQRARVVAGGSAAAIARPRDGDLSILVFEVVDAEDDPQRLIGLTVPVEGTATGIAFTTGQSVVITNYGQHVASQQADTISRLPPLVKDLDSAVAVPLTVNGETIGVLVVARVCDETPFTETEVQLVETFAGHAALAVKFARAEEDRRQLAVFEDRDRIARDLHDLVIQRLFGIGLGLQAVSQLIANPRVAGRVAGFVYDLDQTILELRNSIFSLEAGTRARGGVRWQLLRTALDAGSVLGFPPKVSFDGPIDSVVPNAVQVDLLATLREALSNAARHASPTSVSVDVSIDPSGRHLSLVVADDGVGIADDHSRRSGLANLSERATRWGGRVTVHRLPHRGTKLEWTIVLPTATAESSSSAASDDDDFGVPGR